MHVMLSNDYKRKLCCMAAGALAAFCRTSRRGFASPQSARSSYYLFHFGHIINYISSVFDINSLLQPIRERCYFWTGFL